ncbi:hypothetical protein VP01_3852g2 [Puccinia sorghi]|uniref:HIG1 domain-containing protein n=1 Tax=Puccinia sorghi TaxID=27349 RepID=A0A0L6UT41_9BASI|nr:hypothetical protein VP01_3852g2 [Puccinia sorghi]
MWNLSSNAGRVQPDSGSQDQSQSVMRFGKPPDLDDDDDDDQAVPSTWELFSRKFRVELSHQHVYFLSHIHLILIFSPHLRFGFSLGATTGPSCWHWISGAGATTIALLGAGRAIQRGESNNFNIWCRYRVIFQGLTLIAALGGSLYYSKERNEMQRIKEQEREKMRIYQRDLRIRSQELNNSRADHLPKLINPSNPDLELVPENQKSLFNNQNSQIRKTLLERKISDQHQHLGGISTTPSDKI